MKKAARDANEGAIVKALRNRGCLVQPLMQGGGVPDLLVCGPDGTLTLLEVKDPAKRPSQRRLTPDQVEWHRTWLAFGARLSVVEYATDAMLACGLSTDNDETHICVDKAVNP